MLWGNSYILLFSVLFIIVIVNPDLMRYEDPSMYIHTRSFNAFYFLLIV